jgi:16S rRNA G966 N2-methylase RsmD
MNKETKQFILEHIDDDIHQLALQSSRFPLVDMPFAIRQINGKQKIKSKIPSFFQNNNILYPIQLSLEQSSSESTAKYKSTLCEGKTLTDLTGGFGIDCYFLAHHFEQVSYIEHNAELCEIAAHNFKALDLNNIKIIHADSEKYLSEMEKVDWIFIDPARRSESGKKAVFLSDCEPNISALSSLLLQKATNVMIKLSPMLDITAAVRELPNTSEIHVISVENECKEILLILNQTSSSNKKIKTINLTKNKVNQCFQFNTDETTNATLTYTSIIEKYLYEPNASIMKSGAFKIIGNRFDLHKLQINTHLYTSNKLSLQFPGRVFEVIKIYNNSKSELKELTQQTQKANITTRNYPISVNELRKKLKIKEGGESYLFACTLSNEHKVIIECKKAFN